MVEGSDVVAADIYLPVVLQRIQGGEFKKVDLYEILLQDQVSVVIGTAHILEAQLLQVIGSGRGFIPHGKFWINGGQHVSLINIQKDVQSWCKITEMLSGKRGHDLRKLIGDEAGIAWFVHID